MGKGLDHSLLLRVGIAMAAITLLGFISMLGSVIIEEMTQGEAAAINQAGTLRMQSYRIATRLVYRQDMDAKLYWRVTEELVNEFEQRLHNPRLTTVLSDDPDNEPRKTYDRVSRQWERKIRPILIAYVNAVAPRDHGIENVTDADRQLWEATQRNIRKRYLSIVDRFVADIDRLVHLLEEDAEAKIHVLRVIELITLFLTLGVVFKTMYMMQTNVLPPLRDLLSFAEHARQGDLSVRVAYQKDDELGQLGSAFNSMADELSKTYADLEQRVREKTADLENSNRSLELLYHTTSRLNDAPLSASAYEILLDEIKRLIGFGPGVICLAESATDEVVTLASTRRTEEQTPSFCTPEHCDSCMNQCETRLLEWGESGMPQQKALSIPIRDQDSRYGILFIAIPAGRALEEWQKQLLEAVAGHIGMAISTAHRISVGRRLALYEERNVIARELHDSLAQSLSYLKIQVSRLEAALSQSESQPSAHAIVQEIREGLSSAYRQLRELLTTFRLKMDSQGLNQALEDTVREFEKRNEISILLHNRLHGLPLSANEEIHVLQVIREALSNIARHAQASEARVSLSGGNNAPIEVMIEDNGRGIPPAPERRSHYGLAIMNERVRTLGGELSIESRPQGGTRILFQFTSPNTMAETPGDKQIGVAYE